MMPVRLSMALGQQCPPGMVPQVTISPDNLTESFTCVPGGAPAPGGADAGGGAGGGGTGTIDLTTGGGGIPAPPGAGDPRPDPGWGGGAPLGPPVPPPTFFPGVFPWAPPPGQGFPGGQFPFTPSRPPPPTGPTGPVDTAAVEGILSKAEAAWESAEAAILRGQRCGASESDKMAATQAKQCLAGFTVAAGTLSAAVGELCAAKRAGRAARLNARQVGALETLVACLGEIAAIAPDSSPNWLKAVAGVALPAAASILIAA